MLIYLLLPLIILLFGLLRYIRLPEDQFKKLFLALAFGLLFFFMAFRDMHVGVDNQTYTLGFLKIGRKSWAQALTAVTSSAPVYGLYCKLIYTLFPYQQTLSVFSALIVCAGMAVMIYHFSDDVVCSAYCYVMLWFYASSFNGTRQYTAISLMMMAFCLADNRKYAKAVILGLMAIGVHNTAFVFFPFLFLMRIRITKRSLRTILLGGIVAFIAFDLLFNFAAVLFSRLFPRYAHYLGGDIHTVWDEGRGDNIYLMLYFLIFFVACTWLVIKNLWKGNAVPRDVEKLYLCIWVGLVLGLSAASNLALGRMREYFLMLMCCFIPNVIRHFSKNRALLHVGNYILLWLPYMICLTRRLSGIVPYSFCW